MLDSIEKILRSGVGEHVFTDIDLATLFNKSAQSRYGLVNKALKKGELIRLRRGLYMLNPKLQQTHFSKFYIASKMIPHSYVSLESALAYHGWIPEHVPDIYSFTNARRTLSASSPLGVFLFYQAPIRRYEFFSGVSRELQDEKPFLMASPLRALADLVYLRKLKNCNRDYLVNSLRIDEEQLNTLTWQDFKKIRAIYESARVLKFLDNLEKELMP